MKKGAIEINSLVGILLVIVVLLILLTSTGLYSTILKGFSKDILCESSFIVSAMSRPLLNLGNPTISPECAANKLLIVKQEIKQEDTEGASVQAVLEADYASTFSDSNFGAWDTFLRIKNWNDNCGNGKACPESAKYPYFTDYAKEEGVKAGSEINPDSATEDQKEYVRGRYNMDKIFADEMKRCWNIVGKGDLPLFDTWFQFMDCDKNLPGVQACKTAADWTKANPNVAARFCVLCSRIKFDGEVSKEFKGTDNGKYKSINTWMANNPRQISDDQSYYEYVLDDSQAGSLFTLPVFEYSTDKPYAIVFVRVNMQGVSKIIIGGYNLISSEESDIETNANVLMLIPYEEIPKSCDYLVASTV